MNDTARREFLYMVASYQQRGDPTGWFDNVYRAAQGDVRAIFWADLVANPYLISWLEAHPISADSQHAVTVGCGVGDDAEALATYGYQVTAFDISPTAIDLCRKRYPNSRVNYLVADLLAYPLSWTRSFDLVFECNTIQVLPGDYRRHALAAIANLVAPGGNVLVSCRSRQDGDIDYEFPLPLDRSEISGFISAGLIEDEFLAYNDDQVPSVPHFFACYNRPIEIG